MTATDRTQDGWTEAGVSLPWPIGLLAAGAALLWHLVSLAWLRAPAWKNRTEAQAELQRVVSEHEGNGYGFWARHIGRTKRLEFTTKSGTWYQGAIEPLWDDQPGGAIRVVFALDDGGVGAYHPMTSCLLLDPPLASESGQCQDAVEQLDAADEARASSAGRRGPRS
jgi:hypothetical protein